jgi:uncharacterized membrane protein
MTKKGNIWAIAYDDMDRAKQVQDEITGLAWDSGQGGRYLILLDCAVVVRHPDGTFTLDRQHFSGAVNILACTAIGFVAGLVLAAPLSGATVGAMIGGAGIMAATRAGIDEDFIRGVKRLVKPGTSVLFILDDGGDMETILHKIQGLGGTVVRTNVDMERVKLIQSTLATVADKIDASR